MITREQATREDVEARVKTILVSDLGLDPAVVAESSADTPLIGRGLGLDSMETLSLVAALEDAFDLIVRDEDLNARLFETIGSITEYVLASRDVG